MNEMGNSGAVLRLTTDKPDGNFMSALNTFFAKDGEAWVRRGGDDPDYVDSYKDATLNDYIRRVWKNMVRDDQEDVLPENDEQMMDWMEDYLCLGPEVPAGAVAMLYMAGWVAAELRGRLKDYEDSGAPRIDDGELATLEKAVQEFGAPAQVDMAIEEMSELTKALLKHRRYCEGCQAKEEDKLEESIAEEMADMFIMLYQLLYIFGNAEQVQKVVWGKIERLKKRLPEDIDPDSADF